MFILLRNTITLPAIEFGGKAPAVTIQDGIEALRIALAATEAQRTGTQIEVRPV